MNQVNTCVKYSATCAGKLAFQQAGMSLIELMMVLCITAILLTAAMPAFTGMIDEYRLRSATSALYLQLHQARSEAIKRNQRIRLTFTTDDDGATWCFGLSTDAGCDCSEAASCQIDGIERSVSSAAFPGIVIDPHISSPGDHFTFESVRWIMAGTYGHVRFASPGGKQTRVIVSRMGRTRSCSPEGDAHIAGYATAC